MKITKQLATLIAVLALAAVACGGGASTAPSTEPSAATSTEPGTSAEPAGLTGSLTIWHA